MITQSETHHHHHHHHQHTNEMDSASRFKYESLRAIKRRKLIAKWGFRALFTVAVLSVIALVVVYIID